MESKVIEKLGKPLDASNVKTREQGGQVLSYVEGWYVIDTANNVFGFDAWSRETVYCKEVSRCEVVVGKGQYQAQGWKVGYEAKVTVTVDGVRRDGTGLGSGISKDLFDAIEKAAKEAETDAMKRAFMTFGYGFGLALYDTEQRHVELYVPTEEEKLDPASPHFDVTATGAHITKRISEFDNAAGLNSYWKQEVVQARLKKMGDKFANVLNERKQARLAELEG